MNTPNKITLARLILIPFIVFFYLATFIPFGRLVSAVLFVVACLTDFLDGYLARKNNQVTTLGKFFDSIADKVLVMTGLILIVSVPVGVMNSIVYPTWLGVVCVVIMLAREFIISALRQVSASKGIILAADKGGKVKATAQYVVVSLYMIYAFVLTDIVQVGENNKVVAIINLVMMLLLIATTLLTVYTGVCYLLRNKKVFKTEKQANLTYIGEEDDEDAEHNEKTSSGEEKVEPKEIDNTNKKGDVAGKSVKNDD